MQRKSLSAVGITARRLPQRIETESDVRVFFDYLIGVESLSLHPDTPFSDYVNTGTDQPSYNAPEAERREKLMEQCFALVGNRVYDIGIETLFSHPAAAR